MTNDIYPVPKQIEDHAFINLDKYQNTYQLAFEDPETFWASQAKTYITWFESWEKVLQGGFDRLDVQWFAGGKLNAAYNCLDRHLEKRANQIALIWEGDNPNHKETFTYKTLHENVCRFANVLKSFHLKKGDHVCIYLPMIPEAVIAMLACARIGIIHSIVFAGFSAHALKARLEATKAKLIVTANEGVRGNKIIPLKANVDEALKQCPTVKNVIVVKNTEHMPQWSSDRDYWYHNLIIQVKPQCDAAIIDAQDPLFILYTSGSTGQPKGILHATAPYLVYAAMTQKIIFDYHQNEIFWCTADIGWITGHTYSVYGPLLNGGTTLLFEGVPNYPTPARYWEIIDKHKVNVFYTSPTAIRALRREGNDWVKTSSRSSLRILGTVGEPINPEAWQWYYRVIGNEKCPVVDTWWQTETGGIMISPLPGATPLKPGSACWPFFGVKPAILDELGNPVPNNTLGNLVIENPWPGMMKTVFDDEPRFKAYFEKYQNKYATGDLAKRDEAGYYWILGRSDDVIMVSGHRLGSEEIESALLLHPYVAESAAVSIPDDIKGQGIYVYVVLKPGASQSEELKKALINLVRNEIGPIATINGIHWAKELPKTRSGKIMRRLLKKITDDEFDQLGDLSTLANPEVIETLVLQRKHGIK